MVHRQINPKLQIDGILLTMVDSCTNFAKDISALLHDTYGGKPVRRAKVSLPMTPVARLLRVLKSDEGSA